MCGIVGIFDLAGAGSIERELLHQMNETQFHRGPDGGGIHIEPGVGLGHRRLSIIDLSAGAQPMFNEDNSVVVTFNGEIYNFPCLHDELQALGHIFKTHSDTEVIVHAWEEWGESCVTRFEGMFAFAIWDRNKKTLFIARDPLGKKPLHYAVLSNGHFVFGSELKSLYRHPLLEKKIDPLAIEEYLALGYVADPRCIYKNIYKLPPAHTMRITQGEILPLPKEYWDVGFASVKEDSEQDDIIRQLVERFRDAVSKRMMSEVPLGAFLSGGVDSSAVVAMMADLLDAPVNTCSISFTSPKFNEAEFAKKVADRYSTNHYVEAVNPDDFDLLDQLAGIYDEPYADSSAIPTYRVCELARKRVTVALSGDGADEYFSGYRRHRLHMNEEKIRSFIPLPVRRLVFGWLGEKYPKLDWAPRVFRGKTTFQSLGRDSVAAYFHTVSILDDEMRCNLYSNKMKEMLDGYNAIEVFRKHANKCPSNHPLSLIQYIDLKTYLVGDILTKVDRASMANSLEVRSPLLDYKLVDWVYGLNPDLKLKGQEGKYIFKKAMEPYLPNDVLYRNKMGFAVPLCEWFRGPLKKRVKDSLLSNNMQESGFFNMVFIEQIITQHLSGTRDYSAPIWALLMFDAFLRQEKA